MDDPELDESNPYAGLLSAVVFATRASFHTTLNAAPSQLVLSRDAMLNMEFKADWTTISKYNAKENK